MKRFLIVGVIALLLATVVAVTAFAAPGGPGKGSGTAPGFQGHMNGTGITPGFQGHMNGTDVTPGFQGHMGGIGMMGVGGFGAIAGMHDDLEELLGLSHADIHAARLAGKSLVEIAAEKGVSEAQLTEALLQGRKAALGRAVEDGQLTQAAADEMYKFMEANIQAMVNAEGMGPGMMGGGANGVGPCHGNQAPAQGSGGTRYYQRSIPNPLIES